MDRWTVRALTLQETLRLFQMPLGMDPLLAGLNPGHRLPFVDQPSPDLFTSFFRQLWGDDGGGSGEVEGEGEKEDEGNEEENGDQYGHMKSYVDMNSYEKEEKGDQYRNMNSYVVNSYEKEENGD